jgi:hypothetical protein
MKVTSVSKFKDYLTPYIDFQCTLVRCLWARFAGYSFQTRIRFARFTVQDGNNGVEPRLKTFLACYIRVDEGL